MRIFTHVWYTLGLCVTFCVGNHIRAVGNELPPKFHSIFLNLRRHNGVIAKRKKKCWQHRNEMKRCDYIENRIMKSERDRKNCLFRIILWYICTLAAQEYRPSVTACLLRANIGQLYTKTNISLDIDAICQTSISHVMYETKSENAKKREREWEEREMQFDLKYRIIFNRQFSINHTKTVICLRFSFFFSSRWIYISRCFFISPAQQQYLSADCGKLYFCRHDFVSNFCQIRYSQSRRWSDNDDVDDNDDDYRY